MAVETLTIPEYELPESLQAFFDVEFLLDKGGLFTLKPLGDKAAAALNRAIRNQRDGFIHPDEHILFRTRTWLSRKALSSIVAELEGPYNQFDVTVKRNERGLPSRINQLLS